MYPLASVFHGKEFCALVAIKTHIREKVEVNFIDCRGWAQARKNRRYLRLGCRVILMYASLNFAKPGQQALGKAVDSQRNRHICHI